MRRVHLKRQLLQSNWESVEEGVGGFCGANSARSKKDCWAGKQQIAAVDWGNYCKVNLPPKTPASNWREGV